MNINYGFIKAENRTQYESLTKLKDLRGHYALSSAHRKIIEYIASMPRATGCFACEYTINEQSIRVKTIKTLKRHLKYLLHIKALSVTIEKNRRIFRIQSVIGPVISLKDFRIEVGMTEYAYARSEKVKSEELPVSGKEKLEKFDTSWFDEPLFFEKTEENFAVETANFAAKTANFAPILCKTTENSKNELPPKGSLENDWNDFFGDIVASKTIPTTEKHVGGLLAKRADAGETARPHSEGPLDPQTPRAFLKDSIEKEEWDEPLFGAKKKAPKTQNEGRQEAMKAHAAGHLVNPLGITNNRPKKLNAKLARDIGPSGAVTIPQLYRHLIKLYDDAFGEGIVIQMLPDDKSAVNAWFGNVRQKFITACKYEPTNRDVADYFEWILSPENSAKLLGAAKYSKVSERGMVHFNQMTGLAHIRKFYDQILKKRLPADKLAHESEVTPEIAKIRMISKDLEAAYAEMKNAGDDPIEFFLTMMTHGVALGAESLKERKGLSATECRSRIIHDMSEYLRRFPNKEQAIKDIKTSINIAIRNRSLLDEECVWFEIEKFTEGMAEEVIKKGTENVEGNGTGKA